jgi:hypothetical protein
VQQEWPRLREHLQSMPPGWLGVRTPSRWSRSVDDMLQTAEKLRQ